MITDPGLHTSDEPWWVAPAVCVIVSVPGAAIGVGYVLLLRWLDMLPAWPL